MDDLQKSADVINFASSQNLALIEERNQQIVDGALQLFIEKGYHPTTIREIAKACGMSIGQLYHYISTKDDVLYLVHKHTQKTWYEALLKSESHKIKDPIEKLANLIHYSLLFMVENKKLIQFVYSESKYLDPKYLQVVLDMDKNNVVAFYKEILSEVSKTHPIPGDMDINASIVSFLITFLSLRGWTLQGFSKETQIKQLVDFLLRGLGLI